LHELSASQINILDQFRDDPDDDEGTDTSEDLETDTYYSCTEDPPDTEQFCTCGSCQKMETIEESVCCRSTKFSQASGVCVCENNLVGGILKKELLEINQRTVWSMADQPVATELTNKNYRFSAFRSLYFWKNKKKKTNSFRLALPACLVCYVRSKYPDPNSCYTGFVPSTPATKNKKQRRK